MILQLLIPQFKETDEVIKKMLDSIQLQRNVNFDDVGVIIVNDGSVVHLSRAFLNTYPFEIKYYLNPHKGVSATRNRALKEATADYVMFCDADDMFFNMLSLQSILKELEEKKPDCLYSTFVEELEDQNDSSNFIYNARPQAFVFVHGKIYSRKFLIDNNIYWDEELTLHEDGYFNGLALAQVKRDKLIYCNDAFYLWCNNNESVSRKSPTFLVDTYNENLKSQDKLISKLLDINTLEAINLTTVQLYQTYFLLTGVFREWAEDLNHPAQKHVKEKLDAIEKRFSEFYIKFKENYKKTPKETRERVFSSVKKGAIIFNKNDSTIEDFEKWFIKFKEKYNIEFDDEWTTFD